MNPSQSLLENEADLASHLAGLDADQLAAALEKANCVVTAGAGAGKTTVLAARYIDLAIARRIPVAGILALTFTRKAATEMFERIYSELSRIPGEWAARQRRDFADARITTLDSFCAEIARESARDYGYSSDFAIDPETCGDLAGTIAARYLFAHRDEEGLREALESFPYAQVESSLLAESGRRFVTPLSLHERVFGSMIPRLSELADRTASELLESVAQYSERIAEAGRELTKAGYDCLAAISATQAFQACGTAPIAEAFAKVSQGLIEPEGLPAFAPLEAIAGLGFRSYGRGELEKNLKESAKSARQSASDLLALAGFLRRKSSHDALLGHLDRYAAELAEAKRRSDVMDYKDLGACAVDALTRRTDLRNRWKRSIRSIVIDEFQDNNPLQRDLVFLLAEKNDASAADVPGPDDLDPEKLFFVGDEKQSIYRFRGADVSVFRRLSDELGRSLRLTTNYRSSPILVRFFNDFFGDCFAPRDDEKPLAPEHHARYEEMRAYIPSSRAREEAEPGTAFPSRIDYFFLESSDETDESGESDLADEHPDEILAARIADFLAQSKGSIRIRKEGGRAAEWQDFAILLRTTTRQNLLERELRKRGIPVDSESPRNLALESPAADLYALLALAVDAEDRAAFAAALRSPACGVSDTTFARLLAAGENRFAPVGGEIFPDPDLARLARLERLVGELRERAKAGGISEVVLHAWNQGGLRLGLLSSPRSMPFIEHFDYLYHLAAGCDAGRKSLADFVRVLGEKLLNPAAGFDLEQVPRDAPQGVRILTIHKAKGLQFPIVIIPWVESSASAQRGQALWHQLPEGLAFDLKPHDRPGAKRANVFFEMGKAIETEKSNAEIRRLLYVACTRAEDHLFFFGRSPGRTPARGSAFMEYLDRFADLNLPETPFRRIAISAGAAGTESGETAAKAGEARNSRPATRADEIRVRYDRAIAFARTGLRSEFSATFLSEASSLIAQSSAGERPGPAPEPAPGRGGFGGRLIGSGAKPLSPELFGTLCHQAVEHAIQKGSLEGFAPTGEAAACVESPDFAQAFAEARAYADRFLHSSFFASIPVGARLQVEKPFILSVGAYLITGRMDLSIEDETGFSIVDFKSDLVADPGKYRVQMALYRLAARNFGLTANSTPPNVRIGIHWLRSGTMEWLEDLPGETELEKEIPLLVDRSSELDYTAAQEPEA